MGVSYYTIAGAEEVTSVPAQTEVVRMVERRAIQAQEMQVRFLPLVLPFMGGAGSPDCEPIQSAVRGRTSVGACRYGIRDRKGVLLFASVAPMV